MPVSDAAAAAGECCPLRSEEEEELLGVTFNQTMTHNTLSDVAIRCNPIYSCLSRTLVVETNFNVE